MFENRIDAGRRLAERLGPLDPKTTVVLALPRGGVPVAAEIARATGAPLDLVLVRKVGLPTQPELAIAAIAEGAASSLLLNADLCSAFGLKRADVERLAKPEREELERRRVVYLGKRPHIDLASKTAVLVDDGLATGASMRVAIRAVRERNPAHIIVAVPVAPRDVAAQLREEVDEVICLETPTPFIAIGEHYRAFPQLEDAEVIAALAG
ncbi:MAG: phosphoribosyltransferase family protein [Devosia sp.]|nr:phosphoribosyltransferase family protein [Devosia sp.]